MTDLESQLVCVLESLVSLADNGACDDWRPEWDEARTVITAARAAQEVPNYPAVPEGWKLVPQQMTTAIGCAWKDATDAKKPLQAMWSDMLEAAPQPASTQPAAVPVDWEAFVQHWVIPHMENARKTAFERGDRAANGYLEVLIKARSMLATVAETPK